MQVKIVEGVYGNSIAHDYRRSKLPAKIAKEASFWFLTALLVMAIGVGGFAVGISILGV